MLFADQSKAFERVSHPWLNEVLRRWGVPDWLRRAVMALVAGRAVRGVVCGRLGPRRVLYCSIGMGGTASAVVWCIAYDPVVAAVAEVTESRCPTYVDDMAALVYGPRRAWAAELTLVSAAKCAGLVVEGHSCSALILAEGPRALEACHALRGLPIAARSRDDGTLEVKGMPACLLAALAGIPDDAPWAWAELAGCTCGLKTALVPARDLEGWARALAGSPFGSAAVVGRWPYLGATVAALTTAPGPAQADAPIGEAAAVTQGTWAAPLGRVEERAELVAAARGSPGHRAALWNSYVASVLLYPAQIAPLDDAGRARTEEAFRKGLFLPAWAPVWLPGALHAMFGVAGCPRVPGVAADAAAAMAWCKDGGWGPPTLTRAAGAIWARLRHWAEISTGPAPGHGQAAMTAAAERIAALPVALGGRVARAHLRRAGGAFYRATWWAWHGAAGRAWFRRRSALRRWLPTDGDEWQLLAACRRFTQAWHVVKLLAGGLRGPARQRERAGWPGHRCADCGEAAQLVARTAGRDQDGLAYCHACVQGRNAQGRCWAWLLTPDELATEPALAAAAHGIEPGRPPSRGGLRRPASMAPARCAAWGKRAANT